MTLPLLMQFPALELTNETVGQMRALSQTGSSQTPPKLPEFPGIIMKADMRKVGFHQERKILSTFPRGELLQQWRSIGCAGA
jgi:hypothetical protein